MQDIASDIWRIAVSSEGEVKLYEGKYIPMGNLKSSAR